VNLFKSIDQVKNNIWRTRCQFNFNLRAAFTRADPKSAKNTVKLLFFCTLGTRASKSFALNVDETLCSERIVHFYFVLMFNKIPKFFLVKVLKHLLHFTIYIHFLTFVLRLICKWRHENEIVKLLQGLCHTIQFYAQYWDIEIKRYLLKCSDILKYFQTIGFNEHNYQKKIFSIHTGKKYRIKNVFYCNIFYIFLSQYCAQKCLMWHGPKNKFCLLIFIL